MATRHMAPSTKEYRLKIAKNRVDHPGMKLKDRLELKYPRNSSGLFTTGDGSSKGFPKSPSKIGDGDEIVLVSGSNHKNTKRKAGCGGAASKKGDVKTDKKPKIEDDSSSDGLDPPPRSAAKALDKKPRIEVEINSDGFMPPPDKFCYLEDGACSEMSYDEDDIVPDTDELEVLHEHEAQLDDFVRQCGVTASFIRIRNILRNSEITSWTDLVPSVKMTLETLKGHGIPHDLAGRMLELAQHKHTEKEAPRVLDTVIEAPEANDHGKPQ
ncbi:uncharacterized protein MELLADRAFT_89660 [Melampsora larici-populina 98AG31]|uniref:Uncharacterized protein n=1 Tax=Melampsora larici-populina (strain 98AG31 / pathotype 3-4-7) TaxID=747676 RepID=F4RU54_MELLP|nr:uncharacterized protein MELLADRAFT_89660 [Melampsora larici-populina 98AG31]EGG04141.1 hypothetical protein MELLADRAFT_89660 [Melampsora larici-populina 98AG31]